MSLESYSYEDRVFAQLYDFIVERLSRGNTGRKPWELILYCVKLFGGPILEMGCGTGINLFELAHKGYNVTGLDNSGAMLEILAQKLAQASPEIRARIDFLEGDMINPPLNRQDFRLIIFPQCQFLHLQNDEERLNCLQNSRRLLADDGMMLIWNGQLQKAETWDNWRVMESHPEDEWVLSLIRRVENGEFHEEFRLKSQSDPNKEHYFHWRLYPIEQDKLIELTKKAGLHPSPIPTDLPAEFHEKFKLCAFSRS